jgi:hypothetical protein
LEYVKLLQPRQRWCRRSRSRYAGDAHLPCDVKLLRPTQISPLCSCPNLLCLPPPGHTTVGHLCLSPLVVGPPRAGWGIAGRSRRRSGGAASPLVAKCAREWFFRRILAGSCFGRVFGRAPHFVRRAERVKAPSKASLTIPCFKIKPTRFGMVYEGHIPPGRGRLL